MFAIILHAQDYLKFLSGQSRRKPSPTFRFYCFGQQIMSARELTHVPTTQRRKPIRTKSESRGTILLSWIILIVPQCSYGSTATGTRVLYSPGGGTRFYTRRRTELGTRLHANSMWKLGVSSLSKKYSMIIGDKCLYFKNVRLQRLLT